MKVVKAVRNEETREQLRTAVAGSDLVILSFPLYVDSLPAPLLRALELIAGWRAEAGDRALPAGGSTGDGEPALVAICQSGFPEVEQSEIAIEICRDFAAAAGFQ